MHCGYWQYLCYQKMLQVGTRRSVVKRSQKNNPPAIKHSWLEIPPLPKEIWVFPKIEVPQNGWLLMENPIKMDDLGVPLFSETPKYPPLPKAIWNYFRDMPWIFQPAIPKTWWGWSSYLHLGRFFRGGKCRIHNTFSVSVCKIIARWAPTSYISRA